MFDTVMVGARFPEAGTPVEPNSGGTVPAGKAQTLALAGRHGDAEQTLRQVHDCTSKLPASIGHRDSLFDWTEENAHFAESFVYLHAGNFTQAEQAQQKTLTLYADSNARDSAHIELLRSLCLVRSGDFTQGARHAQTTITNLPVMYRNRPVADLAQKVLAAIPDHERRQSWAKELRRVPRGVIPRSEQPAHHKHLTSSSLSR